MKRHWVRWVLLVAAALPALIPLIILLGYGVDMPFWDQWDPNLAGLYIRAHNHQLSLFDFTAQHSEHRILVPRLLGFMLNILTGWNTIAETVLEWLIVLATGCGVLWLARQTISGGQTTFRVLGLWLVANLLLFSPGQWENWMWGMGLINVMAMFFTVAGLIVLTSNLGLWTKTIIAMLLAMAAQHSTGNGVLSWILLGAALAWSSSIKELKSKIPQLATWGGGFVLNLVLFFYNYKEPAHPPELEKHYVGLAPTVQYVLAFLGNSFAYASRLDVLTISSVCGLLMLLLLVGAMGYFVYLWIFRKDFAVCSRMLPWFLLAGFSVCSAILGALYRARLGVANAISSRYITFSFWLPIAMLFLLPIVCDDLKKRFPLRRPEPGDTSGASFWDTIVPFVAAALMSLQLLAISPGIDGCLEAASARLRGKGALMLFPISPNNPRLAQFVYPITPTLIDEAPKLNELGYLHPPMITNPVAEQIMDNRYSDADAQRVGMMQQIRRADANQLYAEGWAMLPDKMRPADAVFLTYQNEKQQSIIFAVAEGILQRPDLVNANHDVRYGLSGWSATIPISALPANLTSFRIDAWGLDSETGRAIRLAGGVPMTRGNGG